MAISRDGTPEEQLERLIQAIEKSPASYLMNGRSKWTTTILVSLAVLLLGQAILSGFYVLVKAPTTEWVETRIAEKINVAPITPEAQLRVRRNEEGIKSLQQKLDGVQETSIQLRVQVQMLTASVDLLTKELHMSGLSGGR